MPTGNTAKVTIPNNPHADLSVTQTDSPDPVNSGNDVLYHLLVTNNGPDSSDAVTFFEQPTPGVSSRPRRKVTRERASRPKAAARCATSLR